MYHQYPHRTSGVSSENTFQRISGIYGDAENDEYQWSDKISGKKINIRSNRFCAEIFLVVCVIRFTKDSISPTPVVSVISTSVAASIFSPMKDTASKDITNVSAWEVT